MKDLKAGMSMAREIGNGLSDGKFNRTIKHWFVKDGTSNLTLNITTRSTFLAFMASTAAVPHKTRSGCPCSWNGDYETP